MANFEVPFSATGPRRTPTVDEKANGFPCGPADQTLFNGMFHRIEAELGNLIAYAGLAPTDADYTQVRKSIVALIEAATGGGEQANYALMSQLTVRMPVFPEIVSSDGRINLTAPAGGTVRVPGGINILHRGVAIYTTVQTDFATIASRTYHLRWNPTDGFQLKYLQDGAYNPGALAETDVLFDSKYDDMLVARVITNAGNVATMTSLANKNVLRHKSIMVGVPYTVVYPPGVNGSAFNFSAVVNYSRTPDYLFALEGRGTDNPAGSNPIIDLDLNMMDGGVPMVETRYGFSARALMDCYNSVELRLLGLA